MIYIPPLPRGTVRQNFRSCLHRPWKTNEISFLPQPALENRMTPPCLHRPRGSKTKSSLPQPAKGKQSKILLASTGQGKTEQNFLLALTGQGKTEQNFARASPVN